MGFWQFATGGGSGGGSGDVVGPASATDNAIARFDGTTGKLIQNSGVTVADGLTGSVVVGSTGATDNAILRADGVGGATLQTSPIRIADSATGSVIEQDTTFNGGTVATFFSSAGGGYTQARGVIGNPLIFSDGSNHTVFKWSGSGWGLQFAGYTGSGFVAINPGQINAASTAGNRLFVVYPDGNVVSVASGGQYQWSSSATDGYSSNDTGLARSAAGVVKVTDGSTGIRGLLGGGTSVASATALPVPTGRVFHVTGTTAITSITSTNFQAGAVITLIFDDVLTFTDGNNLKLAGDFTTSADDTITLAYDGTNWYECSRSVN